VTPGARRSEVTYRDGKVAVRIAAPATEGKANRALERFLAEVLGVPPSAVLVTRGLASRHKVVHVHGLSQEEATARLAL